jgi:hypothetical protein
MKRLATVLLATAVGLSVSAFAQDTSSSPQSGSSGAAAQSGGMGQGDASTAGTASSGQTGATGSEASSSAPKAKLEHLKGTIGQDGTTFTADKDQKSWTIMNPEAVKGHEGHHVRLSAHVYPDKNQIHVMSVKMAKAKKEKASNSGGMGASTSDSTSQTSSGQPPQR